MALAFSGPDQKRITGIYFGQKTPELLGTFTGTATKLIQPNYGQHFLGFQKGDEYVRLKAFYDTDAILANFTDFPNISRVSYIQIGQVCINGIPIPVGDENDQVFFPSRNPLKLTPWYTSDMNKDYWWIDSFVKGPRDVLFPWKAAIDKHNLKESDLFFFPKEFGTFTSRGNGVRRNGEALSASLFKEASLENVPVTEKPNIVQEMVDFINEEMEFPDEDKLLSVNGPSLSLMFDFFKGVNGFLEKADLPIVDVPAYQNFGNFLLVRANYFQEDDDEREYVYPIYFKINDQNIAFQIFQFDFADGLSETVMKGIIQGYLDLEIKQPIYSGTLPLSFVTMLNFLNNLKTAFDSVNVLLAADFVLQPAGNMLIIRNTFINDEEVFYIARQNPNNTDQLDIFPFNTDAYYDLAQELTNTNDEDPLNLTYEQGLFTIDPIYYTTYYTPDQLVDFMQKKGLNLQLVPNQDWTMSFRYITAACIFSDSINKMCIYDAFGWGFKRSVAALEDTWQEVQFNPTTDVTVDGPFQFFLKEFLDAFYPTITPNPPEVLLNPFLRS